MTNPETIAINPVLSARPDHVINSRPRLGHVEVSVLSGRHDTIGFRLPARIATLKSDPRGQLA